MIWLLQPVKAKCLHYKPKLGMILFDLIKQYAQMNILTK